MRAVVCLLLSLAPASGLWAATPSPQGLIHTLVSSYPKGEQLSLEVTSDGARGFLAEGPTIEILDLTTSTPTHIDAHAMPECQPLAMRHYQDATGHYLFIAGGAFGVERLTLCQNLFSQPPSACTSPGSYAHYLVEDRIENGLFERKRCVDVAMRLAREVL